MSRLLVVLPWKPRLYTGDMERNSDVLRLQNDFAAATAECTAAMNEQFLALIAGDADLERFSHRIAKAHEMRGCTMEKLMNHIRTHGW